MQFHLRRIAPALGFRRIGAIYVWIVIVAVFIGLSPHVFMSANTARAVANGYAISGLAALAILVPIVTGVWDVSIGGNISLSSVVAAALLIHTGWPIGVVALVALATGAILGAVNAIVVVFLKIPSLIGTLAVGGIAGAFSIAFSGNQTLSSPRVAGSFSTYFSQARWDGYTVPILFVVVIMVVLDLVLTQTASGRYAYAVGFDDAVARLAGVRVRATQTSALVISGVVGSFAGLVLTAHVASATPESGNSYLLPAFAAVFVGATQFKAKRFNALGTVIAVFMLGTGQYGLVVAGAPSWSPTIFQGVALIAAIALTHLGTGSVALRRKRRTDPGHRSEEAPATTLARDAGDVDPLAVKALP